jgi:hypothetical protein
MSNQAVFDAALKHIREQGKPSINEKGCLYLSSAGLQCAFAPCIAIYNPELEGKSAGQLLREYSPALYPWARDCVPELACQIQNAHDNLATRYRFMCMSNSDFLNDFELTMEGIAKTWKLKYESTN